MHDRRPSASSHLRRPVHEVVRAIVAGLFSPPGWCGAWIGRSEHSGGLLVKYPRGARQALVWRIDPRTPPARRQRLAATYPPGSVVTTVCVDFEELLRSDLTPLEGLVPSATLPPEQAHHFVGLEVDSLPMIVRTRLAGIERRAGSVHPFPHTRRAAA